MGNCLALCVRPPFIGSCVSVAEAKHGRVLHTVILDSTLHSRERYLANFLARIGLTREGIEHHLPPAPVISLWLTRRSSQWCVKRIKVVITKQQLQHLLTKKYLLRSSAGLEQKSSSLDSPRNWKPNLEPIPEGSDDQ
uniref:Uncharacterized protein n=1 Tax=Salix viminalis TaxID=40686 RepID=A0A6N2KZI3_SALVM